MGPFTWGQGVGAVKFGGKEGEVDAVGHHHDVGAAWRQAVCQQGGGGKDHVSGLGQAPLPVWRKLVPLPVAVIDQRVVVQAVQQMDIFRTGHPQKGVDETMAGRFGGDKLSKPAVLGPEEGPMPLLQGEHQGGQGVGRDVGPYGKALLIHGGVPPVAAGGKKENLSIPNAGDELLGPAGKPAPGLVGKADDLLQREASPPVKVDLSGLFSYYNMRWVGQSS